MHLTYIFCWQCSWRLILHCTVCRTELLCCHGDEAPLPTSSIATGWTSHGNQLSFRSIMLWIPPSPTLLLKLNYPPPSPPITHTHTPPSPPPPPPPPPPPTHTQGQNDTFTRRFNLSEWYILFWMKCTATLVFVFMAKCESCANYSCIQYQYFSMSEDCYKEGQLGHEHLLC